MVDNKNNGTDDDFDDDAFDVDDLTEADYDEEAFDDGLPADDVDLSEEGFDDDWQDDEQTSGKKGKGSVSRGEKKGLSFNTIVILGAVVLGGGVLVFNVMNKTEEQKADAGSTFQSMIDISGIMDGTLFGDKPAEPETTADGETPAVPPEEQGFMNAPDTANPPQPSPITPTEEETAQALPEALTPMPGMDPAVTPRGPEDEAPVAQVAPVETAQPATDEAPTAQDILKRAMENRQQKQDDTSKEEPAPVAQPAEVAQVQQVPAQEPEKLAAPIAEVKPSPTAEETSAGTKILQALESKIGQVLSRMDGIESDLDEVKTARKDDYKKLEDRMASMQKDIDDIKTRPATAPARQNVFEPVSPKPASKKKPKKVTPPQDKAYYPDAPVASAPATVYPSVSSAPVWELRAAQPGRAWVSKAGSKDMQGVVVGENLQGIGKVTGIVYQNGRWTVQGTQGQILQ